MTKLFVNNIDFRHEADYPLIENFSYCFNAEKHYAIIGPSGCGKTTLLHLISGLITPFEGSLSYEKTSQYNNREKFSFIFTRPFLLRELTIYDNITLGLCANQVDKQLLNSLLERFEMSSYINYYPEQLSSGQQQRIAVIRSLIRESDFVLADEPAAHLDAERGNILMKEIHQVLREQKRGLICVTHQQYWLQYFDECLELMRSKSAVATPE